METELVSIDDFPGGTMVTFSLGEGVSASFSIVYNIGDFLQGMRSAESVLPPDVPARSRGSPPEVLKRLPEEQTVELMDLGDEKNETPCSICIEDFSSKSHQNIIKMPGCLHMFHQDCLFEWLGRGNSYPLCRSVPYE